MEMTLSTQGLAIYLQPTPTIDSDSPAIVEFARSAVGDAQTEIEKGVRLYYAVRDGIRYDVYAISYDPGAYKASAVLAAKVGFCIQVELG